MVSARRHAQRCQRGFDRSLAEARVQQALDALSPRLRRRFRNSMLDADHVVSVGVLAHEFDDLAGEGWRYPYCLVRRDRDLARLPLSHLGLMPHRCRRICCTFGCSWSLRMTVCLASLSMPAWVRKALSLRPVSWPKVWSVPRQLYALPQIKILLNFGRTRSPGRSSHGIGELTSPASKTRRNASVDLICLCAGVLCLIDTRLDSLNCHYVNPPTRGFSRMPKERRSRSLAVSPPTPPGWQSG